jgi:GH15 family glucan-1,4-alpha-glucosidase
METRDLLYEEIMDRGYRLDKHCFVQYYDSDVLDAGTCLLMGVMEAVLIMPMVLFIAPNDPRILNTINAIMKPPEQGGLVVNSMCYRYNTDVSGDGVAGHEGTFSMCTFWYAPLCDVIAGWWRP